MGFRRAAAAVSTLLALAGATGTRAAPPAPEPWVGAWEAPPAFPTGPEINGETVRQVMRVSLGGDAVRVRISNEMGTSPLVIGGAHLARPGPAPGSIDPNSDHPLTFDGRTTVTVPPGAPVLSDPVAMDVKALDSLAVSLFVARDIGPTATHPLGQATAFIAKNGDRTGADTLPDAERSDQRFFVSGLAVRHAGAGTVVCLGDSITDGYGSTPDANRRWPDALAERLAASGIPLAVADAGISGNRVLHDLPEAQFGPAALARFDRDVLAVPGVRTVIVMEGINDIGHPTSAGLPEQAVTAADIEAGLRQLVDRARAHGLRVLGATLTPFADTVFPGYFSAAGEAKRVAVNDWIRHGGAFDAVIDFDAALRDPAHPDHIAPQYDHGDHLHPNDAGYRRMADTVDLASLGAP
ncbi:MAG: SGNH/GDSL hydrolase family protein [Gluconacetobacter diazotrophicus]|nr:SGNH/GDSL hydrolase family protein [Gluconacetobacter diazotrophicus]